MGAGMCQASVSRANHWLRRAATRGTTGNRLGDQGDHGAGLGDRSAGASATWEFGPENIADDVSRNLTMNPSRLVGGAGRNVRFVQNGHNSWAKPIVAAALELERLPYRVLDVTAVNHCC